MHRSMSIMLSRRSSWFLLLLLACCPLIQGNLLAKPIVKWTFQIAGAGLLGGRSLRKGNAVTYDEETEVIFVTADDGTLHILKPDTAALFRPPAVSPFSFTECRSGVVISPMGYVVYAVLYSPWGTTYESFNGSGGSVENDTFSITSSYVLAVDPESNALVWSVSVRGYIVGTPVMGANGVKFYVSHNTVNEDGDNQGFVTVINDQGVVLGDAVTSATGPYGPLAARPNVQGDDVVMWAVGNGDGFEPTGQILMLVQDETGRFEVQSFSDDAVSSVTRLALSDTGVWMGGFESTLAGWTTYGDATVNGASTTWNKRVQPTERNVSQPFFNAPIVSEKGSLFVTGTSFDFFCFNASTGAREWTDFSGRSTYMAEPKVSEIASVVYVIETLTGKIRQHDASSGARNWEIDCSDVAGFLGCQDSVEADFSVSKNGNMLFYGDIFGKIVALEVGAFTATNSLSKPTIVATTAPVRPVTSFPKAATPNPTAVNQRTVAPIISPTPSPARALSIKPTIPFVPTTKSPSSMPSARSNIFVPVPSTNSTTPPMSGSGISAANQQVNDGLSGGKRNSFIIFSVIVVVVALMIGFLALFAMQRRRRKSKEVESSSPTMSFDADVARNVAVPDSVCNDKEFEVSAEMHANYVKQNKAYGGTEAPRTPSRSSKRKLRKSPSRAQALPSTPSTLASIVEAGSDDERLSEVGSSGSDVVKTSPLSQNSPLILSSTGPTPMSTLDALVYSMAADTRLENNKAGKHFLSPNLSLDKKDRSVDKYSCSLDTSPNENNSKMERDSDSAKHSLVKNSSVVSTFSSSRDDRLITQNGMIDKDSSFAENRANDRIGDTEKPSSAVSPESHFDESSDMDKTLDAISPNIRLDKNCSDLDAILDAISPDEPVGAVRNNEYDKSPDKYHMTDELYGDDVEVSTFTPKVLASDFDRALMSSLSHPIPFNHDSVDDASDSTDESERTGGSDSSSSSTDSSGNSSQGNEESQSSDGSDNDADDDDIKEDHFHGGTFLPILSRMFGGSIPQPNAVEKQTQNNENAKFSHDDRSMDSSSVYTDEGSKRATVYGDLASPPQHPDKTVWSTIENALGFAADT